MASRKLSDLGEKVDFVIAHCDFDTIRQSLPDDRLHIKERPRKKRPNGDQPVDRSKQHVIAGFLGVDESHWSRMRKGDDGISDARLARLSQYFDMERTCSPDVWTKPVGVLQRTLTTLGYGRLQYRATRTSLKDFLAVRAQPDSAGVRIIVVEAKAPPAERGLCARPDRQMPTPELRIGGRAQVAVRNANGFDHIALLSFDPIGRCTVLAPIARGKPIRTKRDEIVLPSAKRSYHVGRPVGSYRLYAVLTTDSLELENCLTFGVDFPVLSDTEAEFVRDAIAGFGSDGAKVICLPYEVVR